jgi:hypothetical protein
MRTKTFGMTSFLAALLALAGCDGNSETDAGMTGDDGGMTEFDAGMTPEEDAGGNNGGGCDEPREVTLTMGEQEVTGDTGGAPDDLLELSEGCGEGGAGQELLALTLPGSGRMSVAMSLLNDATEDFDSVIEVRTAACESATDAVCFDDAVPGFIALSAGSVFAEGGDTIYVVVSGYGAGDEGAYQLDIEVKPESLPVVTDLDVVRVGDERIDFRVTGSDAGSDAVGMLVTFLDAAGDVVTFEGEEQTYVGFEVNLDGVMTFTNELGRLDISSAFADLATATQVRVVVVDEVNAESAAFADTAITMATEVAVGAACSATMVCPLGYECAGTCGPAACGTPTAIALTPTATMADTEQVTGMVSHGTGRLTGSCGPTEGNEVIYSVTLPTILGVTGWDLIANTDIEETPEETDTVVYIQATCGDPESEAACDDDSGDFYRSTAEANDLMPGTSVAVGVDIYGGPGGTPQPFAMDVTLRAVIDTTVVGCDPMEIQNRCAEGTCNMTTMLCTVAVP